MFMTWEAAQHTKHRTLTEPPAAVRDDGQHTRALRCSSTAVAGAVPTRMRKHVGSRRVDLGAARSVSRVVLRLPAGWGARTQTLSLQAGADGSTFTTVKAAAAYAFDPAADNTVTLTLPATVQRWFRLTVTANSGWPAGQLSEFEVRSS